MKTFIKAIDQPNNKLLVRFKDGLTYKNELVSFDNYFYISEVDFQNINANNQWLWKYITKMFSQATVYNGTNGRFIKLYLKDNNDRYYANSTFSRNNIRTYEGDISAPKRWLIDNGEKYDFSKFDILYYDIETDDRGTFDKDDRGVVIAGTKQIMSIAMEDQTGKQYYFRNPDVDDKSLIGEYNLLQYFLNTCKSYGIIAAWNGHRFDMPYISQRMEHHHMDYRTFDFNLRLINHIDDMEKYKKYCWNKHEKFSLECVARDTIGDGKIDFSDDVPAGNGRFYKLWRYHPEKLKKYNMKDVTLMRKIDEKFNMYSSHLAVSETSKATPEDSMFTSHIADDGLIRLLHNKYYIADSKPSKQEVEDRESIKPSGGYTFCFKPGLHFNVEVFDFKSHYPLVIMTFNMSKETFVKTKMPSTDELKHSLGDRVTTIILSMDKYKQDKKIIMELKKNNIDTSESELVDIMFQFTDKYHAKRIEKHAKDNNWIFTPADLNRDVSGWNLHPHRFYTKEIGSLSKYVGNAVIARDKGKYVLTRKEKEPGFYKSDEYYRLLYKDVALKLIANGAFGFTGLKSSRFFFFDVVDTITSTARWIIKKSILFARATGYDITQGDTDSVFLKRLTYTGTIEEMDIKFFNYFDKIFANFNLDREFEIKNVEKFANKKLGKPYEHLPDTVNKKYFCLFEHEKTYDSIISVAKKRYYYLQNGRVETRGGAFMKSDTNPLAKKLQKELCEDILKKQYDKKAWKERIDGYKQQCFDNKLDIKYLVFSKGYAKHHSEYGGPMYDSRTGKQKVTVAGKLRFKSIPVQIKLVQRLDKEGKLDLEVGDAIKFIIGKPIQINTTILREKSVRKKFGDNIIDGLVKIKIEDGLKEFEIALESKGIRYRKDFEGTQRGITEEEYLKNNELYNADAYWSRIVTPLNELLDVL